MSFASRFLDSARFPDSAGLSRIVQNVDPTARLVSRRLVRRVIRRHLNLTAGQPVPHDFCYELPTSDLLESIGADELGNSPEALPERILLLPLPEDDGGSSPDRVLLDCWRSLFHAAVDRALALKDVDGVRELPRIFNATVLHEIHSVMEGEHRLIPGDDDRLSLREFAAFFLELHFFSPLLVAVYFPGFRDPQEVASWLEERIGARAIFESTRPLGAAQPGLIIREERKTEPEANVPAAIVENPAALARAASAANKGNDVRAAILYRHFGKITEAEASLQHLVDRLRTAMNLQETDALKWYATLRPLLEPASQGFWPVAGRLLYELQKLCLDTERRVYAIDLVEWVITRGKQPVKRPLEKSREVNVLRRLRSALKYAGRVSLSIEQREKLSQLLHRAIAEAERLVRQINRPILNEVLDEVRLVPENQAERIARDKIVEELLDVLCSRSFLKMSDLRDAIARNRLKLDDVAGPLELLRGDPIIQANRKLAVRMDGIYRRGEIYLRGLQRLTSLAFGTSWGRLFTLFVALPFGGAFVLLEGLHHFLEAIEEVGRAVERLFVGKTEGHLEKSVHEGSLFTSTYTIALVGIFLLGMIHLPLFRRQVGKSARIAFFEVPSAIWHSPLLRGLFSNRLTHIFAHYLLTPLIAGSLAMIGAHLFRLGWEAAWLIGGGVALLTASLFRTPLGQGIEERFDELLARVWRVISINFILGLFMLVLQIFRTIFEILERGMYAVDEWFRFREGDRSGSFAFKLFFGTLWFFFAYLFRFAWNLLIEPQINPIKHFPVVTVSHKLLLPMIPGLAETFSMATPRMTLLVSGIPGIFGFLVWECKENWKLYKANRSPVLGPVAVGSHGERVRGLLRPGFHSGVVPKQFAKLRRAEGAGNSKKAAKIHHHLEAVSDAVHHLAERELAAYLRSSRRWGGLPIRVEKVDLATNRLRIVLTIDHRDGAVVVSIEERNGWLIGSLEQSGWLGELSAKQRMAFADALTALYKLAGVHVLREQASAILKIDGARLDVGEEGLVVLARGKEPEVRLDVFGNDRTITPSGPIDERTIAPIAARDLLFGECPVEWQSWVERWDADREGKTPMEPLLGAYRCLAEAGVQPG